jgi:hypothetical protein
LLNDKIRRVLRAEVTSFGTPAYKARSFPASDTPLERLELPFEKGHVVKTDGAHRDLWL